jgi:hypothetical protein
MAKLSGRFHARWHLRRLERRSLLARHPEHGGLIVADPKPPTRIPVLREGKKIRYLLAGWLPDRTIDRIVARELRP